MNSYLLLVFCIFKDIVVDSSLFHIILFWKFCTLFAFHLTSTLMKFLGVLLDCLNLYNYLTYMTTLLQVYTPILAATLFLYHSSIIQMKRFNEKRKEIKETLC